MASRPIQRNVVFRTSRLAFVVTLGVAGCGESKSTEPTTTGPSTDATSSATGPTTTVPGATGTNGATGSTAATDSPGATGATSSTDGATGATTTAGPSGATGETGQTGNTEGDATSDTSTGNDGPAPSSEPTGQSSGPVGSSNETGDPSGTACSRELLDGLLDAYFAALSAGDPSSLPLADDVKFTENAEIVEIGSTAFWMNAGDEKHSQRALDTTACAAAAQAVIPEGATDLPVGIRIKVEAGQLTEIETIVVRPGDYTASFAVESDPAAIIAIADEVAWHDEVPEAQRATREQLTSWIDKYFRAFPSGVCNVTQDCRRLENGGGNFSCGTGASCSGSSPTQGGTFEPRVIVADELRGIAAGFTIFDFQTTGHLDMHMMKMSGGEVHAVHAILRDTNGESGWE